MRWIQAGRRQGYWLVGPSPTAGIAAQTRSTWRKVCSGSTHRISSTLLFNFPTPVHKLHNISALLNGARQGCSGTITKYWFIKHPQSRYILIDQSETLELTTIVASNHIIDRCFSRHLVRSKLPGDLHTAAYEHGEGHGGVVQVTLKGIQF